MSGETSAGTGKLYGIERVCRVGCLARATFYARRSRPAAEAARVDGTVEGPAQLARRRDPVPSVSSERLDEPVRADLAASPFVGEGHRKMWRGCAAAAWPWAASGFWGGCRRCDGCRRTVALRGLPRRTTGRCRPSSPT